MILRLYATLLIVFICFYTNEALSMPPEVITIHNVYVNHTENNAKDSKKKAIKKAQRIAFSKFVASIIPASEYNKIKDFSDKEIFKALHSFEVFDEENNNGEYKAKLSVSFYKEEIKKNLKNHGIQIISREVPSLLVIPLLKREGKYFLWETKNPWQSAWKKISSEGSIVIPLGDVEDISSVKIEDVLSGDYTILKKLAYKYGVKEIVVAEANYKNFNLEVTIRSIGESNIEDSRKSFKNINKGNNNKFFYVSVVDLVKNLKKYVSEMKKNKKIYSIVNITFPLKSLKEWVDIKNLLKNTLLVKKTEVKKITTSYINFNLYYQNNVDVLKKVMHAMKLYLYKKDENWWIQKIEKGNNLAIN